MTVYNDAATFTHEPIENYRKRSAAHFAVSSLPRWNHEPNHGQPGARTDVRLRRKHQPPKPRRARRQPDLKPVAGKFT